MKKRKKWFVTGIVLVLLAGSAYGIYAFSKSKTTAEPPKTTTVKRGTITEVAALSGTVTANKTVEVKSRASGTVVEVAAGSGSKVKKGDLLVRLDPVDEKRAVALATVSLDSSKSRLAQSEASQKLTNLQLAEAKAKAEARRKAAGTGSVTEEEVRAAENEVKLAEVNVEMRKAEVAAATTAVTTASLTLEDANKRLDETTIFAPIDGTVLSFSVQVGNIVSSPISNVGGGVVLCVIGDLSVLHVLGSLDEADVGRVKAKMEMKLKIDVMIKVDAFPERSFEGRVAAIAPQGKNESNVVTFDLDVVVTDKKFAMLMPGMSADLQVVVNKVEDTLMVPVTSVKAEGRKQSVATPTGEAVTIKCGPSDGTNVAVLEGLKEGDEILLNNQRASNNTRGFSMFGGGGRR
ncbi:MAG: efflux RND transporter periplasmic adaptor subunit [Planctomycetes bacterium]|nr:efflux RND transporter periplasmic adaptor subunit [Planctomycetota bacterium]